ncbi:MAG: hypothetical protein FJ102_06650 [Deltaproteobacteria bacterium]|nr:hypothetical protein [Deltaproteobacteria bacterium]
MRLLPLLALSLFACRETGETKYVTDRDEDGIGEDDDCDDEDASVGSPATYYADYDHDGHGDAATGDAYCERPAGYVETGDDCDDAEAAVYPGNTEVCDGLDNDCDGTVDNGAESTLYYADADGDGYGDDAVTTYACEPEAGYVELGGDCNDADAAYNPGALEEDCEDPEDYNCDGSVGYDDADADGFAACAECNDGDATINPGASESCNGLDDDCDGTVDEDAVDTTTYYADNDADGHGDPSSTAELCGLEEGYSATGDDCDDTRADVSPSATEACNGYDDDCDGLVDDADDSLDSSTASTWYADGDADGYGDSGATSLACEQPAGYSSLDGDCDDGDAAYNPAASETDCADPNDYNCDGSVGYDDADGDGYAACEECDDGDAATNPAGTESCDGADNDCDGEVDESSAVDASTWYADADADGYGDAATSTVACDEPSGFTGDSTDCDDTSSAVSPAATELCNGIDDDCDGSTDEDSAADASTWYADGDGDGYGDASSSTVACDAPAGSVADGTDCDDTSSDVSPAATELCNGIDDDCDGVDDEDESIDALTWYADADGDGYGDAASVAIDCDQPGGHVADDTDCDDTSADVSPAATELCNGIDDDCDGSTDEDSAADASTWYADGDGDGYGDAADSSVACDAPAGSVANATDCDDTDEDINPAATEVCDDLDNDCDGDIDDDDSSLDTSTATTWYADADSDGYGDPGSTTRACDMPAVHSANGDDCNDGLSWINPAAAEACDGYDNDCDGTIDDGLATSTWYEDNDGDGYGDVAVTDCAQPSGTVDNDWDCNDASASVYPGSASTCPWTSCLDLLDDGIASADGDYWIDFDGTATETECDMTTDGGGWTLIFSDDFDSGADSGWSTTTTTSCGAWGTILGGYGVLAGTTVDIDADTYDIAHTEAWLELEYVALDSWDGETAYVRLDGTTVWSQAQNNHSTSYSEVCGWDRGYYGSYDSLWPVSETLAQSDDSINVLAGSTLDQGASDESFGIDDVYVWIR